MKSLKNYKIFNIPALNDDQLNEIEEIKSMDENTIDLSSTPELTDKELKTGRFVYVDKTKN